MQPVKHLHTRSCGKQAELRKLLKKNVPFTVTEKMEREFVSAKKAMRNNILLNEFDVTKRTLVFTDASGEGFGKQNSALSKLSAAVNTICLILMIKVDSERGKVKGIK